ncbi:hypothetical protein [Fibrisoma montanum]|uniref:hypothetical protein n=1 Tax=Fibrisoma montanum TaxID=2305895 RepID=UPI0035B65852
MSPSLYIRQLPENRIHPGLLLVNVARVLTVEAAVFFEHDTGGFLPLNDESTFEAIYRALEMSKKTFKKAIGALYKERAIRIEPDEIHLV